MLSYAIAVAVICGCHRIWNYEDIFATPRQWLARAQLALWPWRLGWALTPLLCPACNAFWIGAVVAATAAAVGALGLWQAVSLPFAAYPILRALVWAYAQPLENLLRPHTCAHAPAPYSGPITPAAAAATAAAAARAAASPAPAPPAGALPAPAPGCSSCDKRKAEMQSERAISDGFRQRVVLMTALADFDPSYSLVSVIFDQARALARDPKRLVQVWVMADARLDRLPPGLPANVQVKPWVPQMPWREDVVDGNAAALLQRELLLRLFNLGNATIITHDLMLVAHYTTFAAAIHEMGKVKAFTWIHQIHSCVGARPAVAVRSTLPASHYLAVLNATEIERAAAYYQIPRDRVVVIPNSRDLATWGATPAAMRVLDATDLAQADFAQIFPLSLPRAQAKGLEHAIRVFGALRELGHTTALVVADAHANAADSGAVKVGYHKIAQPLGIRLAFTSDIIPETAAVGLDAATIRCLFASANTFVLPSLSESSGLVALEAVVSGNAVWVNSNVPALHDLAAVAGSAAGVREWPFPSLSQPEVAVAYDAAAAAVAASASFNPAARARRLLAQDLSVPALASTLEAVLRGVQPVP